MFALYALVSLIACLVTIAFGCVIAFQRTYPTRKRRLAVMPRSQSPAQIVADDLRHRLLDSEIRAILYDVELHSRTGARAVSPPIHIN